MKARTPIARVAVEALRARELDGAPAAYVSISGWADRWGLTEAQLLREVADAVHHDELKVTAIEVEAAE